MQFNSYIWDLYKQSEQGKEVIESFNPDNIDLFFESDEAIDFLIQIIGKNNIIEFLEKNKNKEWLNILLLNIKDILRKKINSIDDAYQFFHDITENGINIFGNYNLFDEGWDIDAIFGQISELSTILYLTLPEFFIPYNFICEYNVLMSVFELFGIQQPAIPRRKDIAGRTTIYMEICKILYEFRTIHNLSPQELCAFLYDFAPSCLEENRDELPQATRVWFCGGGKNNNGDFEHLDDADDDEETFWQGNIDTRRGDIVVMYCLSPRSYIHSIWRATTDGFVDPLFYYYQMINIGKHIKTVHISQKELKQNIIFSMNPLVRSNMQGINGFGIKYEEYEELLRMMEEKGQDTSLLPRIEKTVEIQGIEIKDEADVENKLIEPLLQKLEYKQGTDYIRQMPLRMGRNYCYYPDYAFIVNRKKGEETAMMVLEAKESISTQKDIRNAFLQARSYAVRLQSKYLILAAKQGIRIYFLVNGNFNIEKFENFNWVDIYEPDNFNRIIRLIGKKVITGKKEII